MKRKYYFELSEDWTFEIDLKCPVKRFGFLFAPAAIHFRIGGVWLSLINTAHLYLADKLLKLEFERHG